MYCIKCGVKLGDGANPCPLCGTVPFHPDIREQEHENLYPESRYPADRLSPKGALIVVTTVLFLLPMVITLQCDLLINGSINWCGYVIGALMMIYVPVVLPYWFAKPNPVIFVPCSFAAIGLYLLYISLATGGKWFLSFAFPVVGAIGLIVTAVVTLVRYIYRGRLYIFGGAFIAGGAFMPVMEVLLDITFLQRGFQGWSLYPLATLVLLGLMLIFIAVYPPARESMERKFFL